VRPVAAQDADAWLALRDEFWPDSFEDHAVEIEVFIGDPPSDEACFVAELDGHGIVGFTEVGLRRYAEGSTTSPVGYLEGIFVAAEHRRAGIARLLAAAGEYWAVSRGCTEMASDRDLANEASGAFHDAVGYREAARSVCYIKPIGHGRPESRPPLDEGT